MKKTQITLPDTLFGKDVSLLIVWLPLFGVSLFLFFLFTGLVLPRIDEIKNTIDQINKVTNETKLLNDKRIYLLSLNQEELLAKTMLVENGVLSEKNSYLLIKIINNIVSNYEYTVGDFAVSLGDITNIDQKSAKFDYQKVPVDVILVGPKTKFMDMVSEIEKSLPVLSIDQFSMTSVGEIATIKMSVSAYYLPDWTQTKLETLSVTDLTPDKNEAGVLSKIENYKYYGVKEGQISNGQKAFEPVNREDPFF